MFNSQVKTVAEFLLQKRNPYKILVPNLHNFVAGTTIPSTFTKRTLNCYYTEKSNIGIFWTEHLLDWSKNLSDTVSKIDLPKPVKSSKKSFTSNIPSNGLNVKKGTEAQWYCKNYRNSNFSICAILFVNKQFIVWGTITIKTW